MPVTDETYEKARPAWGVLAERFAALPEAEEAALYRNAGADNIGFAVFADKTKEGVAKHGGACVLFAWPLDAPDGGYQSVPIKDYLKDKGAQSKE